MGLAPASRDDDTSIRKLTQATQIETNRIYESATPSELAQAFEDVLHRPDAKDALVYVFEHAKTDAGRIYALTGLNRVDKKEYHVRLGQVNPESTVKALWYDIMRIFTVKELAKMIEAGELQKLLLPNVK